LTNITQYNASVNFYMFHGGTNFGFMNGANNWIVNRTLEYPYYLPDITSYGRSIVVKKKMLLVFLQLKDSSLYLPICSLNNLRIIYGNLSGLVLGAEPE